LSDQATAADTDAATTTETLAVDTPAATATTEPEATEAAHAGENGAGSTDDAAAAPEGADYASGRRFDEFPLSEETLKGLSELGYEMATPVQAMTIEPGLAGKDMLVRAKTGTGKTCAFGVPIVERVKEGARVPQAIVLAPTRELANQVAAEIAGIAKYRDVRVLPVYGGAAIGPQEDALRDGVEIIVGTPGRVLDHIKRGNLDLSKAVVSALDEADEMLSMGFFEDVSKILKQLPKEAQTLLFSATVDESVKRLVSRYLYEPLDLILSTDTDHVEGITHVLFETNPGTHRARALLSVVDSEEPGSTIIFCNTREDTATVATFLARQGLDAELISGELPQKKRDRVMAKVKSGEVQFLVATDVAARGIDISDLSHVINYSLPDDPAVYMHRIGRTGRIGKEGTAISLAGGNDLSTRLVLEKQFKIAFELRDLPTAEEAGRLRMTRQAARLQSAMGTSAFEGFIPLVRALKERDDGDLLLATALRAFFLWDRQQRAGDDGDTITAVQDARQEKRERRSGGGRGRGRDRDDRGGRGRDERGGRGRGRDRDRNDRGGPRSDRPRSEAKPAPSGDGGGDKKRRRRRRRRKSGDTSQS